MATIIGQAKLREDENDGACDCCGRAIRRLVHLSDGRTVGRDCAMRVLGFKKASVDGAFRVFESIEKVTGFYGLARHEGRIVRVQKSCIPGVAARISEI